MGRIQRNGRQKTSLPLSWVVSTKIGFARLLTIGPGLFLPVRLWVKRVDDLLAELPGFVQQTQVGGIADRLWRYWASRVNLRWCSGASSGDPSPERSGSPSRLSGFFVGRLILPGLGAFHRINDGSLKNIED
jgi:hypothetical protein